jgi:hypothetical protein
MFDSFVEFCHLGKRFLLNSCWLKRIAARSAIDTSAWIAITDPTPVLNKQSGASRPEKQGERTTTRGRCLPNIRIAARISISLAPLAYPGPRRVVWSMQELLVAGRISKQLDNLVFFLDERTSVLI